VTITASTASTAAVSARRDNGRPAGADGAASIVLYTSLSTKAYLRLVLQVLLAMQEEDIEKTQKDVLFGVLFYIALFVPSYK